MSAREILFSVNPGILVRIVKGDKILRNAGPHTAGPGIHGAADRIADDLFHGSVMNINARS